MTSYIKIILLTLLAFYAVLIGGVMNNLPASSVQSTPLFQEVVSERGLESENGEYLYSWGDFNNDDFPDLVVTRHAIPPRVYKNINGTFHDLVNESGIFYLETSPRKYPFAVKSRMNRFLDKHGCGWADYNNDGLLDLYISNGARVGKSYEYNQLYENKGSGRFIDVGRRKRVRDMFGRGRNIAWSDIDNDGFLDLFVANALRKNASSIVYRNRNKEFFGRYQVLNIKLNGNPTPIFYGSWNDIDNNGFSDLTVYTNRDTRLTIILKNNGNFLKQDKRVFSNGYSWIDIDNDGDLDLILSNNGVNPLSPHKIHVNSNGRLSDSIVELENYNSTCNSVSPGDFDNDGDVDLFFTCKTVGNKPRYLLYLNNGGLQFEQLDEDIGLSLSNRTITADMATWVDYDNDGDLDLFTFKIKHNVNWDKWIKNKPIRGGISLFENSGIGYNWIKIKLSGKKKQ